MYQGKFTKKDTTSANTAVQEPRSFTPPQRRPRKTKTPVHKGTALFYSIFGGCILLFVIALIIAMSALNDWLIKFESSQPTHKRDEVYQQYFADPDWEKIYVLAGMQDSKFDNKASYAAYMEQLVGDEELICNEISAGLSGDKKYLIKLGDEKIASFILTSGGNSNTDIPKWELGKVELFFSGNHIVTVEKRPGQTIYINGIALDDSYTIRTVSTLAEKYLPEGLHGYRLIQQQVTGLLNEPQVSVKDAQGNDVPVIKDAETGIYKLISATQMATTEEKKMAYDALYTYGLYMIERAGYGDIAKHFATDSKIFDTIIHSETFLMQAYSSFQFTEPVYSNYYRYSDTLFSIHVDMTLNVTRTNGTIKPYPMKNTLFFAKKGNNWIVTEMTNLDVQTTSEQVLIRFMDGETLISESMVDSTAKTLTLPTVDAPEDKVLKSWAIKEVDSTGAVTMTPVYTPGESSEVYLPSGTVLEPVTLYALYEEVSAAA